MKLEKRISKFHDEFEPQLINFFERTIMNAKTSEEQQIWEAMRKYVLGGGKRIRPFLLWQMLENKRAEILGLFDVLIAFELLHNSTLIEDDIIDQHTIRRHKPTLPVSLGQENLNGEHISLVAAGLMRCAGLNLILQADISAQFREECVEAYAKIAESVNQGQTLDLYWTRRLNISEEKLLLQTEKVAARFIEYMFRLGAVEESLKNSWDEIGLHLGIIFQLVDDLLDVDRNKNKGRPIGDDIRLGKTKPLIIFAFENLTVEDRTRFKTNFGKPNIGTGEMDWMIEKFQTTGAIAQVKDLISDRLARVDSILNSVGIDPHHWIHELKKFSVERVT